MNFKVVINKCNSKHLWLNNTKRPPKCPECGAVQHEIVLWCKSCNKKIITSPLSGQRLRCYQCSMYKNKKDNKTAKRDNREKNPLLSAEGIREHQKKLVDIWFQDCRDLPNWGMYESP